MNATEIARRKYADLMARIEQLEDEIAARATSAPPEELRRLEAQLGEARTELARLSDGCGVPHAHR